MLKLFVKTFKFPQLFNAVFLERDRVTVSGFLPRGVSEGGHGGPNTFGPYG
jgi:hypothetical protein